MCETFKWIKLLAVELPKNGLQIRLKSDARAFQSTLKMQSYLASITFAILFSLTFVIFPLGQYYISL